ncbi:MAG: IMPACT family protein [Halanaerobiaceae bacterium]
MKDYFYVPKNSVQIINKVKDSKFYGSIDRVENREEAEKFITKICSAFHDATHNVFAYIIKNGIEDLQYYDDDGEPAGSSGPPVLQVIEGENLTNTIIVVTRYFGGTKLGIGGLIRAYSETAKFTIRESGKKRLVLYNEIKIQIGYDLIGTVMGQVEALNASINKTEYTNDGVNINIIARPNITKKLNKVLIEKTGNKVKCKNIGNKYI